MNKHSVGEVWARLIHKETIFFTLDYSLFAMILTFDLETLIKVNADPLI